MAKRSKKRYLFDSAKARQCQLISTESRRRRKEEFLLQQEKAVETPHLLTQPTPPPAERRYNLRRNGFSDSEQQEQVQVDPIGVVVPKAPKLISKKVIVSYQQLQQQHKEDVASQQHEDLQVQVLPLGNIVQNESQQQQGQNIFEPLSLAVAPVQYQVNHTYHINHNQQNTPVPAPVPFDITQKEPMIQQLSLFDIPQDNWSLQPPKDNGLITPSPQFESHGLNTLSLHSSTSYHSSPTHSVYNNSSHSTYSPQFTFNTEESLMQPPPIDFINSQDVYCPGYCNNSTTTATTAAQTLQNLFADVPINNNAFYFSTQQYSSGMMTPIPPFHNQHHHHIALAHTPSFSHAIPHLHIDPLDALTFSPQPHLSLQASPRNHHGEPNRDAIFQ